MPDQANQNPTARILQEINQQSQALKDLNGFYINGDGRRLLEQILLTGSPLFTGMGASFHAACVAADLCFSAGVAARAVETSELLTWPKGTLSSNEVVIYLSQSGASAEVAPFLQQYQPAHLIALTNDLQSPLAGGAEVVLPLCAGIETLIASKTYLNSLALLWLISRRLAGTLDGSEEEKLKRLRQRVQVMLDGKEALFERWQTCIEGSSRLILTGSGLQGISARQTALMLAEWGKVSALPLSFGSLKHGFVELAEAGVTVVVFQPGSSSGSEEGYLHWLIKTGAAIIRVIDGFPQRLEDPLRQSAQIDPGLSPILDTISGQMLAVHLADKLQTAGFRYLSKVVK